LNQLVAVSHRLQTFTDPLWACSRRRRVSQYRCRLIHRLREQARSHRGMPSNMGIRQSVIAGRQAPTVDRRAFTHPLWERACSRRRCVRQYRCQLTLRFREQARSHRGMHSNMGIRQSVIAGRPAPTVDRRRSRIHLWERACSRRRQGWRRQFQARRASSMSVAHSAMRRQASASWGWSTTRPMRICPAALGPKASPASTDTP